MSKRDKLLKKLGNPDQERGHRFEEVMGLLPHYGYEGRQYGTSHVVFELPTDPMDRPLVLFPEKDGTLAPYIVRQVRRELKRRKLIK